jgi:hypothetical protein
MKRTLLAASLIMAFGAANAAGLSWVQLSTMTRSEVFDAGGITPDYGGGAGIGTTVSLGYLTAATAGPVKYTFLGQESGFLDNFKLTIAPGTTILDTASVGTSALSPGQGAGILNFRFEGDTGKVAYNGLATPQNDTLLTGWCSTCSIGLIGTNMTVGAVKYDFVIGYNDSAGSPTALGDWDDMVIGVTSIPEPETYAMLLAGLGLLGFMKRRKKER